jgi:hypothetical protein
VIANRPDYAVDRACLRTQLLINGRPLIDWTESETRVRLLRTLMRLGRPRNAVEHLAKGSANALDVVLAHHA